ncbi:hypothetical protein, partial [Fulvivirga aurantia]|uniref:hypothetical protein n=1 Tax=Fulvivirga aurantia TaxID=2529383 RepID=UPI0012BCB7B0
MLALIVSTQANARVSDVVADNSEIATEPTKKQIDPEKLPMAVKEAINKGDLVDWKVVKAFEVKYTETEVEEVEETEEVEITNTEEEEKVEYEIHFENVEMETKTKVFDKN